MDHRVRIAILGTVLAAVIAAFVLTSSFQLVTEPGGYFRIAARQEPAGTNCFDTDGGANQFVRGATRYLNWSFLDDCSIITGVASNLTGEAGNLSILYEGYCSGLTQPVIVQFNCTAGCENGACLR